MDDSLLSAFSENSEEEQRILRGEGLDKTLYTRDDSFIVNGARLGGNGDITARLHTRYIGFPPHSHNFMEMMTVQSGSITHRINGKVITLEVGDILFINKHLIHSIDKAEKNDLGVNIIMSDRFLCGMLSGIEGSPLYELITSNSSSGAEGGYIHFRTRGIKAVENQMDNILRALITDEGMSSLLTEMTELLLKTLTVLADRTLVSSSLPPSKKSKRQSEILTYIKSSYRTATLGELAKRCGLSVPYLSAEIKRMFSKSFGALLIEERLNRADELITATDLPIGEVIRSVGYENESYFHREYKKRFGMTPLSRRKDK